MTISDLMDIYYPSNFGCFDKTGVFQQSRLVSTVIEQRITFHWNRIRVGA